MVAHPVDEQRGFHVTRAPARWVRTASTMAAITLVAWGATFLFALATQPIGCGGSPSALGLNGMGYEIVWGWWAVLLALAGVNLVMALGGAMTHRLDGRSAGILAAVALLLPGGSLILMGVLTWLVEHGVVQRSYAVCLT